VEVERTVTFPIENAMNGIPRGVEIRSVSRFGLSAVTIVFEDGTDVWFARQLVLERLRGVTAELPPSIELPSLAPVSSGLGTIYKFVVKSEQHSPMQLRTLLDWEIVPKLRGVKGVIDVNTMGGDLKQYQVVLDRARLQAHGLTLGRVAEALRRANVNVGGGYIERRGESFTIRGEGMLKGEDDVGNVVVHTEPDGTPVLVKHLGDANVGPALRYGVVTHNGDREAVSGVVMMLLGSNSRDVIYAVKDRMEGIKKELPPGVGIDVIYDRADFVERTLSTVMANLVEGLIVVTVVLAILLGTIRGALAVALGIPTSMAIALFGMHYFHITGDLMSLGAIDFGFLVDGPIVILESVMAATMGKDLIGRYRAGRYSEISKQVATPVAYSVAIIMLVYIPLLTLEGVEGKMFRPMALTMACALFGALVFSVVFFPALLVTFVPPPKGHGVAWLDWLQQKYGLLVGKAMGLRYPILAAAFVLLFVCGWAFGQSGAEFVPRIFEGDAIIAMRRAPSISLEEAKKLDLLTEKIVLEFPEAMAALGQSGRPELALDSVGNDNTDILVPLRPLKAWKSAEDFDGLSELWKDRIESEVPGTFVSVSQPIEDLTNQMISGSRADVSIKVFGADLDELVRLSNLVGEKVGAIRGTGDLRIERILGKPMITVSTDRAKMARYGVRVNDALDTLAASREGLQVGDIYESQRRFQLRVFMPPSEPTAQGLGDLLVETESGRGVPLHELVNISEGDGPAVVKRQNRERIIRIDVNLRGRDLVSWVAEAKAVVAKDLPMGSGYRVEWGGQFENFERASKRLAIVLPIVVGIIVGMLLSMFKNFRFATAVFLLVPLAAIGGMMGLLARGLPFSLPAAIGFIALGGISVLNGVVIATEAKHRIVEGMENVKAIERGAVASLRAVLTTGAVAAFGFLPMALSTGAGSEVQKPLATVVIAGIGLSTILTLLVFPGILQMFVGTWVPTPEEEIEDGGMHASAPAE
jgi:heavy metal efflux system protein